jgi:Fe2+ transport system protein B
MDTGAVPVCPSAVFLYETQFSLPLFFFSSPFPFSGAFHFTRFLFSFSVYLSIVFFIHHTIFFLGKVLFPAASSVPAPNNDRYRCPDTKNMMHYFSVTSL